MNSRYYDPEIGRFLNADEFVSTGQGIVGYNMFAYCGNNPVNRVDPTGHFWSEIWEFANTAVSEIGQAMRALSPAYAGCSRAAVADGPLPFGDAIGLAGAALLTVGAIGYGIYQAAKAPSISIPKVEEKEKDITVPKPPRKDPVHHIVAQWDHRAEPARNVLKEVGINRFIDPANLVQLPAYYHVRVHSDFYYEYVNEVIITAYQARGRDGVYSALAVLKWEISSGAIW